MKKVIIFTEKSAFSGNNKNEGGYDKKELNCLLDDIFPTADYKRSIRGNPGFILIDINSYWMIERLPILIGVGMGADYIEPVKNFDIKFLISPSRIYSENLIDEYNKERTICLFGGDEKSLESAEYFKKHYKYIITKISKNRLKVTDGIEYIKKTNLFLRFSKFIKEKSSTNPYQLYRYSLPSHCKNGANIFCLNDLRPL